tara:strand:+ start:279 stop:851 length:573 start_codon:yes stop_codon:yes gene_type:complete
MKIFKKPVHLVCGKEKYDSQFHYIYFKNGFMHVSNGQIAIKQHLSLFGLSAAEQFMLSDLCIHKDAAKFLYKKDIDLVTYLTPEVHFHTLIGQKTSVDIVLEKSSSVIGKGKIVDQINKSFETFKMNETREVAINPESIVLAKRIFLDSDGITFRFNKQTGGVLLTPNKNNSKEHAMVIPLMVTGEFKKQ